MSEKLTYKPEQVRAEYIHAVHFKETNDRFAEKFTPITEEDEMAHRQMILKGNYGLDTALQSAKRYAEENDGALHEQARFDMESDLEHKKRTVAGFEKTEEEIKNLPESDGPNN